MKLSVCIVTKDRYELFMLCFESVLLQQRPPDEIIIIDSSTHRMQVPRVPKNIRVVYVHTSLTVPQARDKGVRVASGDLVMFVDDDCIITDNTTEKFLLHFVGNPRVDLVMGDLVNSCPFNIYAQVQHYFYVIWMKEHFYDHRSLRRFSGGMVLHFDIVCFRKKIFDHIVFDIQAPKIFNDDDIDIGMQLYRMKYGMFYDETIGALYQPRNSFISLVMRNKYTVFSNHYSLDKKHINVHSAPHKVPVTVKIQCIKQAVFILPSLYKRVLFVITLSIYPFFYKIGWIYYWYWKTLQQ